MYINIYDRRIYLNMWDNVVNPKGVVQVIHGMAEYGERYASLASFLNSKGFIVVASDHYGHRNSINKYYGELGSDDFLTYVQDESFISNYLYKKYEIPIHILGHSMGSFITQYLMQDNLNIIQSYCLIGSCYQRTPKVYFGSKLISLISLVRTLKEDKLIDKLMFGNFNRKFERNTNFDWLSKNDKNVINYINDVNCGKIYPTNFYKALVKALWNLHNSEKFIHIQNKKNLLILSGKDDPVGEFSTGVIKLNNFYKKLGFSTELHLYKDMRHELLNEDIQQDVFNEIYYFLIKN